MKNHPDQSESSQFRLLATDRFLPFFLTQFFGAFNDNLFKNSMVLLITFKIANLSSAESATLVNAAALIFILPFFLFSATSGQLSDKFERSRIMRMVKLLEIAITLIGAAGFIRHDVNLLFFALFLLGTHSTLFGPAKYAILPQHLHEHELMGGNGLVEMGTFVAILVGTLLGGYLMALDNGATVLVPITTILVACVGYATSRGIPDAPAPEPHLKINWNPLTETWRTIQFTRENRTVFLSVLGISWYWLVGALFLSQFPAYAKDYLGGGEGTVTLLLAVFALGVGVGSILCERLSGHKIEIGLVPFGAIGITVFAFDLFLASPAQATQSGLDAMAVLHTPGSGRVMFDLALLGVFGGFFIVPLYALVQSRSNPAHRSRVIAGNNILNALFMVTAAIAAMLLLRAGLSLPYLFLVAALANAAVSLYIFLLVPEFLMRFIVWMLIHSIYRLKKSGLDHLPENGPALIVCNHVSYVDALVIAAACPRPIRFVMDHNIFKFPVLSFVFRHGKAIPIAPARENAALLDAAYEEIARALDAGDLVAIFPEGRITDNGELYLFKNGVQRILARSPVPVIPMALRGLWGSMFSRKDGPAFLKAPRKLFSAIELAIGPPVPPEKGEPAYLQAAVQLLRGNRR
jgi:1-acyl-sn-glycerol-3-phosphate acyltransferase